MASGASERGGGRRGPGALGVQVPRPSGIAPGGPNRDASGDRRARERHGPALYWPRRGAWLAPIGRRDSTFRFSEPRLLGVADAVGGACAGGAAQGREAFAGACLEFRAQESTSGGSGAPGRRLPRLPVAQPPAGTRRDPGLLLLPPRSERLPRPRGSPVFLMLLAGNLIQSHRKIGLVKSVFTGIIMPVEPL